MACYRLAMGLSVMAFASVSSAAHASLVPSFIASSSVPLLQPLAQPRANQAVRRLARPRHMTAAHDGETTTRAEVRFSH